MTYPQEIVSRLTSVYEELIWLANRPYVTPRQARAWYSAVLAETLKRKVRRFSGLVSQAALDQLDGRLVLEHFNRLSHSISRLLELHISERINDPSAFLVLIAECEQVHITTEIENHRIREAAGDYGLAGVHLVQWQEIEAASRVLLYQRKLRGQVANAADFAPVEN
jgi:hypothetical protein